MFKMYEMISRILAKGMDISYNSAEDNLFFLNFVFQEIGDTQLSRRSCRR